MFSADTLWFAVDDFVLVGFDFLAVANPMATMLHRIHFTIGILAATSGFGANINIGFGHGHGLTAKQRTK